MLSLLSHFYEWTAILITKAKSSTLILFLVKKSANILCSLFFFFDQILILCRIIPFKNHAYPFQLHIYYLTPCVFTSHLSPPILFGTPLIRLFFFYHFTKIIVKITGDILIAKSSGQFSVFTFLDLSTVFNTVNHSLLFERLYLLSFIISCSLCFSLTF